LPVHLQLILLAFDDPDNLSEESERANVVDEVFRKGNDFVHEGRGGILEVLKGYGSKDGFQSSIGIFWDNVVTIVNVKLFLKSNPLVNIICTDK
jgi:hypothetical protein